MSGSAHPQGDPSPLSGNQGPIWITAIGEDSPPSISQARIRNDGNPLPRLYDHRYDESGIGLLGAKGTRRMQGPRPPILNLVGRCQPALGPSTYETRETEFPCVAEREGAVVLVEPYYHGP